MKARIFHKIWQVIFVAPSLLRGKKRCKGVEVEENPRGDCDDPTTKNKKIRVANNLPPIEQLEVVIHECLHASDWFKDEEWIEEVAIDIARLLWRLGWRLTEGGALVRIKKQKAD